MISESIRIKAQFYHLDPMEIVWHGNYPRFFEQARCALLDKLEYNYPQMRESGFAWPVVDMRIKYIRSMVFAQEVTVTASLKEYENRMKIDYLIADCDTGEKLTKGFTVMVAVEMKSKEMCFASPKVFLDKVAAYQCDLG
jgi:acyl-CoA thioester hydrolase